MSFLSGFILLFSGFYLFLAKKSLKFALSVLIFLLPVYLIRFKVLGIPFTMLEVMIFTAFGVWLSDNYKIVIKNIKLRHKYRKQVLQMQDKEFIRYPFSREIILVLMVSYMAIAIAGFSNEALGVWKAYFFEPLLLYILVLNIFGKDKKEGDILKYIITPLALSAFTVSIFAIYQKITGDFIVNDFWAAEATRRVTSFFDYPNAVGLYLGPILLIMLGGLFTLSSSGLTRGSRIDQQEQFSISKHFRNFTSLLIIITIILSLLSIYFAKSEGALIAVIIALFLFGLFINKKIRYSFIVLAVIGSIGIFSYAPVREKVIQKVTLSDLSGEIRKQQWRETWMMMTSSPKLFIFGTGLSAYQKNILPYHQEGIFFNKDNDPDFRRKIVIYNDKYRAERWQPVEIYMYPHNILLNFWTELGLMGLILFIWIIVKFFMKIFKLLNKGKVSDRFLLLGLMGSMMVIVVHGLVDVPYFKNDLAMMFWLIVAMVGLFELERKYNIKKVK